MQARPIQKGPRVLLGGSLEQAGPLPAHPPSSKVVLAGSRGALGLGQSGVSLMFIQELVFQVCRLSAERPRLGEVGPLGRGVVAPLPPGSPCLPAGGAALWAGKATTSSLWSCSIVQGRDALPCPGQRPVPLLGAPLPATGLPYFPAGCHGNSRAFEARQAWCKSQFSPLTCCVASGKCLYLSEPHLNR